MPRTAKASVSGAGPSSDGEDLNEVIDTVEVESTTPGASSLLAKAVSVLGYQGPCGDLIATAPLNHV